MIKSVWKDPVWSAVIAAAIIATCSVVGSYFLGYWPSIARAAASLAFFFVARSEIANWATGLLLLGAIPTLIFIVAWSWQLLRGRSPDGASWQNYTSDHFFGLRWRWQYVNGRIDRLNTFCPNCDYQIFPYEASSYKFMDRIGFSCDSCNGNLGEHDQSYDQLRSKVERFIQQRIRNNTWDASPGA